MRVRKINSLTPEAREKYLKSLIDLAKNEPAEMQKKWRTDVIGIAMQYGGRMNVRRSDFKNII